MLPAFRGLVWQACLKIDTAHHKTSKNNSYLEVIFQRWFFITFLNGLFDVSQITDRVPLEKDETLDRLPQTALSAVFLVTSSNAVN
jgi:hypothetical protein